MLYWINETRGDTFLVLEYISNWISRQNYWFFLSFWFLLKILHKRKFIYRGLKPSNVILNVSNHIILIDFDGMTNENGCNSEFARDINAYFSSHMNMNMRTQFWLQKVTFIQFWKWCITYYLKKFLKILSMNYLNRIYNKNSDHNYIEKTYQDLRKPDFLYINY